MYLYSPGVVAELHPNGKVLHPLDSITSDTKTHQIMERVTCPAGVADDEVCVTKHRAAIVDVSVQQCREACDKTELCVAFTHHVATDDTAKVGGFGHTCTLLAGVSGDGAVSRASSGSNEDDVAGEPRVGLRGHTTYFLQPETADLSQIAAFKHLNSKCDKAPAAGSNVAEQAPKDCVVVDEDYESAVAAMGARFSFSTSTMSHPEVPFDVESQDMASEPHSGDDEKTDRSSSTGRSTGTTGRRRGTSPASASDVASPGADSWLVRRPRMGLDYQRRRAGHHRHHHCQEAGRRCKDRRRHPAPIRRVRRNRRRVLQVHLQVRRRGCRCSVAHQAP